MLGRVIVALAIVVGVSSGATAQEDRRDLVENFIDAEKIIQIDTLPMHRKYGDVFLYTDVPEAERIEVAEQVADKILAQLKDEIRSPEIVE